MKKMLTRMWQSATALLMALCLTVGLCPTAAFAQETEGKTIKYVSLGDSMTNGYCFEGYEQGEAENIDFFEGEGVYGVDAYPLQFEAWLEEQGYTVEHTKLAPSAMRAEDLNYLLGGCTEPVDGWFEEVEGYTEEEYKDLAPFFQKSIAEADLITMCIGNASFGAFMLHRVTDALGILSDSASIDPNVTLENALALLEDDEQKALVMQIYDAVMEQLLGSIPENLAEEYSVDTVCDIIAYTAAGFVLNYKGALERIVELNPDVEIILIGLMNTTYGMNITIEGMDDIAIGDIMDDVFSVLNAYIAGLPTVMQAAGEWGDAEFYYAEQPNPLFISQQFAALKEAGWENVDEGRLSGKTVRERNISAYNGYIREMISEAFKSMLESAGLEELPEIGLEDVQDEKVLAYYSFDDLSEFATVQGNLTTAEVLGDSKGQSYFLNEPMDEIKKVFSEKQTSNMISVMLYDNMQNTATVAGNINSLLLGVNGTTKSNYAEYYQVRNANKVNGSAVLAWTATEIKRTKGWHELKWDFSNGTTCVMYIDGKKVHEYENTGYKTIYLGDEWGSTTAAASISNMYFDDLKVTQSQELSLSAQVYLAIEDAVAASTDTMDIPLTGLMKIADDLPSVFSDFSFDPASGTDLRTQLGNYLTSTDELKAICKIYALFKVGNGMSVHPTPSGHDNIAEAVIAAYENQHTAEDETLENVQIALKELYQLLEQYGPKAAEQAYQYAVDAGYVEALETAIEELKAELETRTQNFITEIKPEMEAAAEKLQAQAAALNEKLIALKAELEAKKAELETIVGETAEALKAELEETIAALEAAIAAVEAQITDIEATIENLKNGLSVLGQELEDLGQTIAELENAAVAIVNVLKSAADSVEDVIAAVNAAKDTLQTALDLVVSAYGHIDSLVDEVTGLAESVSEKVNALVEMVSADLMAAYDALPEEVKALIGTAVAEIQAAAEEAKAEIMAELEKQIEALKAEIQPVIDAKLAELEAVLAQMEAEIEAKAAELKAQAEAKIAELTAAAEAKKAELIAAAEAAKAELEAELARKQAELEALMKELENAAEDVKAELEAKIQEVNAAIADIKEQIEQTVAELEEQIAKTVADLEAAVAALQAEVENKIAAIRSELEKKYEEEIAALEKVIEELKTDLEAKVAELTAAAEAKIAELKAAAEAKIAELMAAEGTIAQKLEQILEEAKAVIEAVKAEAEAVVGETIDNVEELIAAAKAIAPEVAQAIEEKVQEVAEAVKEAYINATTSDYVPDEDSFYVAIGDSSAVSQSYVDMLAETLNLGDNYANLAQKDLMIEDTYAVLEQNAETVAKADLITVGFTSNGFVNKAIDQVFGQTMGGAAALDWAAYVGEENVPYVQELLAQVSARIAESVEDASFAAMMSTAVEAYAYSCVAYACNLPEVINAIRAINPDAAIIIVGMYNPLEDMSVVMDENTTVNVGEYLDYLTTAAGIHATAYCMLTSNGVYIAAPDVQTVYEENNGAAAMSIEELIYEYVRNKGDNMLPSELGHEYIAAQIANALGKKVEIPEEPEYVLPGDVDMDGDVDGMDLLRLQKYLAGDSVEIDLKAADVYADEIVDGLDLLRLQKHLAGDNVTLG